MPGSTRSTLVSFVLGKPVHCLFPFSELLRQDKDDKGFYQTKNGFRSNGDFVLGRSTMGLTGSHDAPKNSELRVREPLVKIA